MFYLTRWALISIKVKKWKKNPIIEKDPSRFLTTEIFRIISQQQLHPSFTCTDSKGMNNNAYMYKSSVPRLRSKPFGNVQDALALGGGRGLVKGTENPAPVGPGVEGGAVSQRLPALVLKLHCGPYLLGITTTGLNHDRQEFRKSCLFFPASTLKIGTIPNYLR